MKATPWTEEQMQQLLKLAEKLPFFELVERMNQLARLNGWPQRSRQSVKMRLWRCGVTIGAANGKRLRAASVTPTQIRWSAAEVDLLDQLAEELPFELVIEQMQSAAERNGWPIRSKDSIICRLHRTGQVATCRHGEWMTLGAAGEALGCSGARVFGWIRQERVRALLKPRWSGDSWYVTRDAWRRLAREMPHRLGGFHADRLFVLLEDRKLAEQVAAKYPIAFSDWRIRCIETGQTWSSCGAAARELHVSHKTIATAIRERRAVRVLGMTFEALRGQGPGA